MYLYAGDRDGRYFKAYLDGRILNDCVEADEGQGWARVFVRDADGHLVRDGDHLKSVIVYGVVELRRID